MVFYKPLHKPVHSGNKASCYICTTRQNISTNSKTSLSLIRCTSNQDILIADLHFRVWAYKIHDLIMKNYSIKLADVPITL